MADSETEIPIINATLNETAANATAKIPASPEGMAIAYGGLVIMALFPIFWGSLRSVKYHKEQKASGEKPDTMSNKDAAMFPIIASCTLFGIYIVFQIFSKDYINLLLTVYFFFLGVLTLAHIVGPFLAKVIPATMPNADYHLLCSESKGETKTDIMDYKFDRKDLLSLGVCGVIGVWYLLKKHWIANNLFGLAFSISGIEYLSLNRISTGCVLLGGLFMYDIFWVFGTNVMVTVAKSFEAPIKLVFPQDLLEKGLAANNFAMLGLGDIVIPGIFIALLLRFDLSQKKSMIYFYTSFAAYFLGLMATILVMHFFKHAQPALLYLVPACIGAPLLVALIRGELVPMFKYADHVEEDSKESDEKDSEKKDSEKKEIKKEVKKEK